MIGELRQIPDVGGNSTTNMHVYVADDGAAASLNFGRQGGALAASVWTTLEGLAQVRDALTEALDAAGEREAERDREAAEEGRAIVEQEALDAEHGEKQVAE